VNQNINTTPLVTIVVPSLNQGIFIEEALTSIFIQNIPLEVFVMDGGSSDNSKHVIHKWESRLSGWRSHQDNGQAAAINEGISLGSAPYVSWLNSDDWLLPGALETLVYALETNKSMPAAYGQVFNFNQNTRKETPVLVEPFEERRLSIRCIISQPGTLIRRQAWQKIGGLDETLNMALDYDLWWRLYRQFGHLKYVDRKLAINRLHANTKTVRHRRLHYSEAMKIVKKYYGSLPLKWWLYYPYAVWIRSLFRR
jgi:glycosyltransferase involved in cell wall biosynthesis